MTTQNGWHFDEIGPWSEVKLDIMRKYAKAYCTILRKKRLRPIYVDAFAGAGVHKLKRTGEFTLGSPMNALLVKPPFAEFHLIDFNAEKTRFLDQQVGDRPDVHVYCGDCNEVLLSRVLPTIRYENRERALCILDPYGLQLNWEVIERAGKLGIPGKPGIMEIFLNFPVLDMNRNVLHRDPAHVSKHNVERMNAFWGDESWRDSSYYTEQTDLFGDESTARTPRAAQELAVEFRKRLQERAGFEHVPEPMPMRNSSKAILYYLFFAAHQAVAKDIVESIFDKYRRLGGS